MLVVCFFIMLGRFTCTHCGSRWLAARTQISVFVVALQSYRTDVGDFPSAEQGLDALVSDPGVPNWHGPYLQKAVPVDPWGHHYVYRRAPGATPEVVSFGADGAPGGSGLNADISSLKNAN